MTFFALLALVGTGLLAGCGGDQADPTAPAGKVPPVLWSGTDDMDHPEDACTTDLVVGRKHHVVGSLHVWNDAEYVYVKYSLMDGWGLYETHVQVWDDADDLPVNRGGNPPPGQFEYKGHHDGGMEYTYMIPIDADWECDDTFYVAAHAELCEGMDGDHMPAKRSDDDDDDDDDDDCDDCDDDDDDGDDDHDGKGCETAWAKGMAFPGGNWAMYTSCALSCEPVDECPTVEPGDLGDGSKAFAARFRSFGNTGGGEMYLGVGDLGVAENRVEQDFGAAMWGMENAITFSYDPMMDKLTATVDTGMDQFSLEYMDLTTNAGCGSYDFLVLSVVGRDEETTVELRDLMLGDCALGDGPFVGEGWMSWKISGFDWSQGFTFTGTIYLDGTFGNSQELSKVEFLVGCDPMTME
jgi:hypothetical protein